MESGIGSPSGLCITPSWREFGKTKSPMKALLGNERAREGFELINFSTSGSRLMVQGDSF